MFMNKQKEQKKSQVEDQQRRDGEQQKLQSEQTEVHKEIINTMHEMSKNPSSIDKKGANWLDKMEIQEKTSTFPIIPTTVNETILGQ